MNENRAIPMEVYYTSNGQYSYQTTSENFMGFFDGLSHPPLTYLYPPLPMPNPNQQVLFLLLFLRIMLFFCVLVF